ncbi:MAG: S8 family serine peptidase [Tumebacillaceae bacterium]
MYEIKPEVTAPGVSVFSTVPPVMHGADQIGNYTGAYDRLSGTSMATPNTVGVVALMLQAHPGMSPADIKTTLMNTADPLNANYSVYEVGAGRVDPYKAVHADSEMQVLNTSKTLTTLTSDMPVTGTSKNVKTITDNTGELSFGSVAVTGKDLSFKRSVVLHNNSDVDKTYNVSVKFQSLQQRFTGDSRTSNNATANGVTWKTDASVTVSKKGQKTTTVTLNIPKSADLGTYEGYLVYTNKNNPEDVYRIPFGIHTEKAGISALQSDPIAFHIPYESASDNLRWETDMDMTVSSHMRYFDVFLKNAQGKVIGYVGEFDGMGMDTDVSYHVHGYNGGPLFDGHYFPVTGNSANPISHDQDLVKEGVYKLQVVATGDDGKTYTSDAPFYVDQTEPKLTLDDKAMSLFKDGVYEYNLGETVSLPGNIYSPDVNVMKAAGLPVTQADNFVTFSSYLGRGNRTSFTPDKNGNFTAQVPMPTIAAPFFADLYGINKGTVESFQSMTHLAFVPKGTAYATNVPDKTVTHTGENVTYTMALKNVPNINKATFSYVMDANNVDIVDVKPHPGYEDKVDVTYTKTPGTTSNVPVTITVAAKGDAATTGFSGNLPLVDVTYKHSDSPIKGNLSFYNMSATYTTTGSTTAVAIPAEYVPTLLMPTYSEARYWMNEEGFLYPDGSPEGYMDWAAAGAKIKVTDATGKINYPITWTFGAGSSFAASYKVTHLPLTNKPFNLEIAYPGHFTVKKTFTVGFNTNGTITPEAGLLSHGVVAGGDVNGDGVIDILDAMYIKDHWGTTDRNADINYDKTVDSKDMAFVVNNFGMQSPWMKNAPKAKTSYKGMTLDSILKALHLK